MGKREGRWARKRCMNRRREGDSEVRLLFFL